MNFGQIGRTGQEEATALVDAALEAGINIIDTADMYSAGQSEEMVGKAIVGRRDDIVLATKANMPMGDDRNHRGSSRRWLITALDDSLRRLGVDYVDLYQIHRWDPTTPIEETLDALNDVVRAGKARYIGASSMFAWQFAQSLEISKRNGWARFVSMQNFVNLIYREEEREMLPLCKSEGIGVIPWSPLARGRLARPWNAEVTNRSEKDPFGARIFSKLAEGDRQIIDEVGHIAARRNIPRAQVALAWLLRKSEITAPIIGATKPVHLQDAVAAMDVKLTEEEVQALEAPYAPHPVAGITW
jgi:1-deoxyxylulose-5-phosphate synthase